MIEDHRFFQQLKQTANSILPTEINQPAVLYLILLSLQEDLAPSGAPLPIPLESGDITSNATLPDDKILNGVIRSKQAGVIAGLPLVEMIFRLFDPMVKLDCNIKDGMNVSAGQEIVAVSGKGRAMLAAERTALNFLGRLSGIASLTNKYVEAVKGTRAVILDTRKTAPGFRLLDKYAVRMGGGMNHRHGLYDMVLIKDNHIDGAGGIEAAVRSVREQLGSQVMIEVEVKNKEELLTALELPVQRIMLDNMSLESMKEAVRITNGKVPLEASGNVNLSTVRQIAETGVDYISVGALTHSAPVLDLSMRLEYQT